MDSTYISYAINILLIVAFIIDRVYRIQSSKDYKDAKEAQIASLKQQLEFERSNNDIVLAKMHKERYESLKIILDEKVEENDNYKETLLALQFSLQNANKEADLKRDLSEKLLEELNKVEKSKHLLEIDKKILLDKLTKLEQNPPLNWKHYSFDVKTEWDRIDEIGEEQYLKEVRYK